MSKKLISWDDVALALPAVVWTKLLATFDALGAAAAVTPASIGAATPASVTAAVAVLVNAAPGAMDTLGEIAAIIASDESAAAALLSSVAAKATTAALTAETTRAGLAEVAAQTTANAATVALTTTAVKTGAYAPTANQFVPVDATGGPVTLTIPTAPPDKTRVGGKKIDASVNLVTFQAGGADVFNTAGGGTTKTLTLSNQALTLQYAAAPAIWYLVSDDIPLSGLDARYANASLLTSGTVADARLPSTAQAATLSSTYGLAQPASIYVSTTGSDANNGKSWVFPKLTIEAAAAALPTTGGVAYGTIFVGPGSFTPASVIALSEQVSLIGSGAMQTIINCTLNGDHITARMATFTTTKVHGPTISGFTLIGNAGASAVGIHMGDINGLEIHDLYVRDFTGTSSVGLLMDNINGWSERLLMTKVAFDNCTYGIRTITANLAGGNASTGRSYDYHRWFDVCFTLNTGQIGISNEGTSDLFRCVYTVTGNVRGSGATTIFWNVQDGAAIHQSRIDMDIEQSSGSGAYGLQIGPTAAVDVYNGSHLNTGGMLLHTLTGAVFGITNGMSGGIWPVTFSATPAVDASIGRIATLTLTGNVTSSTIKNGAAGQELRLVIIQDATGGRKMVWPTNINWAKAAPATYAANEQISVDLWFDGVNWNESARVAAIDPIGWGVAETFPPAAASANGGCGVASRAWFTRAHGSARNVSALLIAVGAQSGNICVGVYTNVGTGTSAQPGVLKATTGGIACPAVATTSVALTSTVDIEDGDWLALVADNTTATFARGSVLANASGYCYQMSAAYPLPATLGTIFVGINPFWIHSA